MKKLFLLVSASVLVLQAHTLTMDSCIQKAQLSHPDIRTALLKTEQFAQSIKIERSAWRPQVSLFGEYDPQKTYLVPKNGKSQTLQDDGWDVGVSAVQKIYDFSRTEHKIAAAKIEKKIASLSLEDVKNLMRYQVSSTYVKLLLEKAAIRVRKKDLQTKQAFYEQAVALVQHGLKTSADESRFLAAVEDAKDALAISMANYEKAKIALEALIGEPIARDTVFQNELLKNPDLTIVENEKKLLQNNPSLKAAQKEQIYSNALYKSSKAQNYGSFDAVADYTHFDALSNYDTTLFGVRYKVPIYSGNRIKAQTQQAKISEMGGKERMKSRKRALLQEYRSLLADIHRLKETINAKKAQVKSAKETQKVVEGRYKEGLATYIEVLDASSLWLDARLGQLIAYFNTLDTAYHIQYLIGNSHEQ